jgi:hypothetical protein
MCQSSHQLGEIENENAGPLNLHPSELVDFGGKGKYRAPEFIWFQCVAPTALKFLNSTISKRHVCWGITIMGPISF